MTTPEYKELAAKLRAYGGNDMCDYRHQAASAIEAQRAELDEVEAAVYGRHERGFVCRPLIDPPSPAAAVRARIEALEAERDRCHARLEIDHYFTLGDNDDSDLERVDIPMDERATIPDGITARDATIALIERNLAAAEASCKRLEEALRPFAEAADSVDDDVPDRAEMWEHPAAMQITAGNLRAARLALQENTP